MNVKSKKHVNLGCSIKGLSKTEQEFFEGRGKTIKHIKVFSIKNINGYNIIYLFNNRK